MLEIVAAGRHVVCEKPLAMTAEESADLVERAAIGGKVNAVNFNIRFYPLNQHAHELVASGELGEVRLVTGRYFQDWLLLETDWDWRLDPERGGALRAVGDIGSHWLDLVTFITGRRITSVMAELATFIPTRRQPAGPVETSRPSVPRRRSSARSGPRTPPRSSCASRAAPVAQWRSASSARATFSRVRDRRLVGRRVLGL